MRTARSQRAPDKRRRKAASEQWVNNIVFTLVHITFFYHASTSCLPGVSGESHRTSAYYLREAASQSRFERQCVCCTELKTVEGDAYQPEQHEAAWGSHHQLLHCQLLSLIWDCITVNQSTLNILVLSFILTIYMCRVISMRETQPMWQIPTRTLNIFYHFRIFVKNQVPMGSGWESTSLCTLWHCVYRKTKNTIMSVNMRRQPAPVEHIPNPGIFYCCYAIYNKTGERMRVTTWQDRLLLPKQKN